MNRPIERVYSTRVPIYDHKLKLIVTKDVDQSARVRGIDGRDALACTIIHDTAVCILIPEDKHSLPTLSHEVVHAAFEVLKRRDISVTYKSQEALAYLVGWIMHWINRVVA